MSLLSNGWKQLVQIEVHLIQWLQLVFPSKGWAWWVKGPSKRADKNYCRPEAKHDGKRPKDWAPKRQKEKKQAATSKSIIRNQTGYTH